jgi:hypothetical protein
MVLSIFYLFIDHMVYVIVAIFVVCLGNSFIGLFVGFTDTLLG